MFPSVIFYSKNYIYGNHVYSIYLALVYDNVNIHDHYCYKFHKISSPLIRLYLASTSNTS